MIRAGAIAPQPPPFPPSHTSLKPRYNREAEVYKERLVHRVRQAGNLREKVVQLASRKENVDDIPYLIPGQSSGKHHHNNPTDNPEEAREVTVLVYDLKNGDNSNAKMAVGCSALQTKRSAVKSRKKWEKVGPTDSDPEVNATSDCHTEQSQSVNAQTQRVPQTPDSAPCPRSAALRHGPSHPHPPSLSPAAECPQPVSKHNNGVPASGVAAQGKSGVVAHGDHQQRQNKTKQDKTRPVTTSTTTGTGAKTTVRSPRTPSRILVNQGTPDIETCSPSITPRSQQSHSQPGSQDTAGHTVSANGPKQTTTTRPNNGHHPHSPSDLPTHNGRSFNYRRAARILQARSTAGGTGHSKNVRFLADDNGRRHNSSGSSGASPHQTGSRGAEEAVGEVRGSALHSSPLHLHAALSPRRADHKNPSHFASSLEMFKRRLKMNTQKLVTPNNTQEEDYVIRIGDTVQVADRSYQKVSGFKLRPPAEPYPPSSSPSPATPQPHHQQQQHEGDAGNLENPQTDETHGQTHPVHTGTADQANGNRGFRHLKTRRLHPRLKGEDCSERTAEQVEEGGGRRRRGRGGGATAEEEEDGKDCTTTITASCRLPESVVETWTYVPLREALRAPLPQVKTYVVDNSLSTPPATTLPLALTLHNVRLHDTFIQRRLEREKTRLRRAQLERRAGFVVKKQEEERRGDGGGGGGGEEGWAGEVGSADAESRMRRWLIDTEHQRDMQPMVNFKIAIPAA